MLDNQQTEHLSDKESQGIPRDRQLRVERAFPITFMKVLSIIWVGILVVYFLLAPSIFWRLWPNEVGDLLSGWFAPLAMAWVAAAAFLQRDQLVSQKEELRQNSEALRLQAEALRRSIEEFERQTEHRNREAARRDRELAAASLNRLYERLMFGVERVARIAEGCKLHDPSNQAAAMDVSEVLGEWRKYADWSRSNDVARSVDALGKGLNSLIEMLKEGWTLDMSFAVFSDLCIEFHSLERIVLEVDRVAPTVGDQKTALGWIEEFDTHAFREKLLTACMELEAMEGELRKLDFPDSSS
jgi:hypothetical protein